MRQKGSFRNWYKMMEITLKCCQSLSLSRTRCQLSVTGPLVLWFKHLLLRNSHFIWNFSGMGERKFVQMVLVTWPRWPPCPFMVKTFFSGTQRPLILKLGLQHLVLKCYYVCSNYDPGLTLTYFTTRSNLVPCAFVWEKGKTIVVHDIKVGRCS